MKNLQGKLTITKVTSSSKPDYVSLVIEEDKSHCRVIQIKISLEQFAKALFAFASRPCEIEFFNDAGNIGMTHEIKHEIIRQPARKGLASEDEFAAQLAPFETEGWVGRVSDLNNHHNMTEDANCYTVFFERWVPAEDSQ